MRSYIKHITLLLFLFGLTLTAEAQQFPLSSHYTINPYSLNPAFAGAFSQKELFLNYRKDWTSIVGSPQTFRINGNTSVHRNMWLGGEIMADQADIFYRLRMSFSYTYRLQIAYNQNLSFGLAAQLFQSVIRIDQTNANLDDPLLQNLERLVGTNFNAAVGLVYNINNLHIGLGLPILFRTDDAYSNASQGVFAFERAIELYITDKFDMNHQWRFQPGFVMRKTINQPVILDFSTMFIYEQQVWLGAMYRNTALMALTAGGKLNNGVILNYTYELGLSGINNQSGGSHEVSFGYQLDKDNSKYKRNKSSKTKKTYTAKEKREKKKKDRAKSKKTSTQKYSGKQLKYAPYEKF